MKKTKKTGSGGTEPEFSAVVLTRLRQAFQKRAHLHQSCPDPEKVIAGALGELEAAERDNLQEHLLACRDCLDLFLDVRLAQAEAEAPLHEGLEQRDWLAAWGRQVWETLQTFFKPRKLIPALATVSLVALVFILGREDRSRVLPTPHLAMEQRQPSMKDQAAVPPPETRAVPAAPPAPPAMERQPLSSKMVFEALRPPRKKVSAPAAHPSTAGPIHLDSAEVPAPGGGSRLSYKANRDVYVYLLWEASPGKIIRLFSDRLEGGKSYFYSDWKPLRERDPNAAQATIYLVASEQPLAELPETLPKPKTLRLKEMQRLFPGAVIRSQSVSLH